MKKLLPLLFILLAMTAGSSYGQISNLKILGSTSNFSITSGDNFGWSYNVPKPGDTTLVQIWIDADQNGQLDPTKDVLWTFFNHIDGDPHGQSGPPDGDGAVNGAVAFEQPLGLAPAHYIILFRNHGHYTTARGVVNHMASPTYTISGTVTVPNGMSKKNIVLSLEGDGEGGSGSFWDAVTDDNGNYTIQMNADTAGGPWYVKPNNIFVMGSAVLNIKDKEVKFVPGVKAYTGNNFTFTAPSATISGKLKDDSGHPIIGGEVSIVVGEGAFYRYSPTDTIGTYHLGLLASELPQTTVVLESHTRDDNNVPNAYLSLGTVSAGNNITRDLVIYKPNATISGKVTIDGHALTSMMQLSFLNADSLFMNIWTDGQGNFSANVTSKIYNYMIYPVINYMNGGQSYNFTPLTAHPGQSGLVLDLKTPTDVKKETPSAPAEYRLKQNYPNPFNPTTTISYSVAKEGYVSLTVYNLLGNKVATLVSENMPAGEHSVQFDGSSLSSGIYIYRLESGNFVATRKFALLK